MWALGLSFLQINHGGVPERDEKGRMVTRATAYSPPFLKQAMRGVSSVRQLQANLARLEGRGSVHTNSRGTSFDKLVEGLLRGQPHTRDTVGTAIQKARKWASEVGLSNNVMQEIEQKQANQARQVMPKCWTQCKQLRCGGKCITGTSGSVSCDNQNIGPRTDTALNMKIVQLHGMNAPLLLRIGANGVVQQPGSAARHGLRAGDRLVEVILAPGPSGQPEKVNKHQFPHLYNYVAVSGQVIKLHVEPQARGHNQRPNPHFNFNNHGRRHQRQQPRMGNQCYKQIGGRVFIAPC